MSAGRPAIFLDRDGVLNELVPDSDSGQAESPLRVADVRLIPGAAAAASSLRAAGYTLVCVTNQPAAAKAKTSVSELEAIQRRVGELLAAEGAHLDAWRMCLHHPAGVVPELSGPCACRKPAPGMLLDAASELGLDLSRSWLFGDTDADMLAGRAAGCRTALIEHTASAHKRLSAEKYDLLAKNLADGVAQLLALHRSY
ncbi:MAG: HAD-IIIA family hydrolase [Solirubrobacteraceae bacterium]